jgi:hypothetical protein
MNFKPDQLDVQARFIAKQSSRRSDFEGFRFPYYSASNGLIEALSRRRTDITPRDREKAQSRN